MMVEEPRVLLDGRIGQPESDSGNVLFRRMRAGAEVQSRS
jgi:hypothetical protein